MLLLGVNPSNVELIQDQLFASTSFYGRRGVVIQALSGIDLALWDLAGKQAGMPVHRFGWRSDTRSVCRATTRETMWKAA